MSAIVGMLAIEIYLRQSQSLKDKRRTVKSFKERVRARHNVAVAEVGDADDVKRAELAVVSVANEEPRVREVLDAVAEVLRQGYPEAEVLRCDVEFLYADGPEWDGLQS